MQEATKAAKRRATHIDNIYSEKYFVGRGIDIGCGNDIITKEQYPNATEIVGYDLILGHKDAQILPEIADNTFDFVHSSHCLEHCHDPVTTLQNWLRVIKPAGYIIICVPDMELYEQGQWPSRFNHDHKVSFTTKPELFPNSIDVKKLLDEFTDQIDVEIVQLLTDNYDFKLNALYGSPFIVDQTYSVDGPECAIELVIRKK